MRYTIHYFGQNCREIWESKEAGFDLIRAIEELDMKIGYKCAPELNKLIRKVIKDTGRHSWEEEVPSDFYIQSSNGAGKKEVDLRNEEARIDVEIELGNVASAYRDMVKFNLHYNEKKIDVGVIILCSTEATRFMGENIARAERTIDELSIIFKNNPPGHCPIVVIGLEPYDNQGNSLIDPESEIELKKLKEKRKNKNN